MCRRNTKWMKIAGACLLATGAIHLAELAEGEPTTAPTATNAPSAAAAKPAVPDLDFNDTVTLVPTEYRHRLVQQLSLAEDNQQTWLHAIADAPADQREAVAFLLLNMPETDLTKLRGDYLVRNVALAYKARNATAFAKAVPQEIFFREVLPYANVDEARDDWRQDFYDRFMPLVKDCKTATEAAMVLNRHMYAKTAPGVAVKYHATKRDKPNQSPYESMKIGYASCTGLSILLVDACRSVGVPARVAGTPLWSDKSGNHTWTEVWDRQWYFAGSAEPGKTLNDAWFSANAAKADASDPMTRIYATEFQRTDTVFPLVWNEQQDAVRADDVTGYYVARQKLTIKPPAAAAADTQVKVTLLGKLLAQAPATADAPATFELAAGQTYRVVAETPDGRAVAMMKDVKLPKDAAATVELAAH